MAKKKTIAKESVKAQDEFVADVVEDTQDEVAAVKSVAKKKGLSSFGSMLAAKTQSAKSARNYMEKKIKERIAQEIKERAKKIDTKQTVKK